jgi:hypothetical protein
MAGGGQGCSGLLAESGESSGLLAESGASFQAQLAQLMHIECGDACKAATRSDGFLGGGRARCLGYRHRGMESVAVPYVVIRVAWCFCRSHLLM